MYERNDLILLKFRLLIFMLVIISLTSLVPLVSAQDVATDQSPFYTENVQPFLPDLDNLTPAQVGVVLARQIHADDSAAAVAAGFELLRRAGIPLVSPEGPVIAIPDNFVLEDAALYAEFVTPLVNTTRRGDFYTPEQLSELIAGMELTSEPLPPDALVAGLGMWGKTQTAPAESQLAGAAVRMLSAYRQQVLYAGVDLNTIQIDPLQTVLILSHLTAAPGDDAPAKMRLVAQGDDPCLALKGALEGRTLSPNAPINEGDKHGAIEGLRGELINAVTGQLGEELGGLASTTIDRGTKGLNLLLLLMGAQLDLTADKTSTHFKHSAGSRAEHVNLTATARFDSALAQARLTCYELGGLTLPPNGPLEGFKVRWNMNQPTSGTIQEGGKYLTTISADSSKIAACGTCGELTGKDGRSTLELYPRVERNPGEGKVLFGNVPVYASLDKADFPFKLSDLISFKDGAAGAASFAWVKLYDLMINALTRAGLPTQSLNIRVEYHGYDIYTVKGESSVWLFYVQLPVKVDLYTCTGLGGPWMGTAGMPQWDPTFFGEIAAMVAQQPLPADFEALNTNMSFNIPVGSGEGVYPFVVNEFMTGELEIDSQYMTGDNHGFTGKVGESDMLVGINSLESVCDVLGGMCSVKYPIMGVLEDERCGEQNEYYFERL